jgi:hypothetical protein
MVLTSPAAIDIPITTRRCVMNDRDMELLFLVIRVVLELLKKGCE